LGGGACQAHRRDGELGGPAPRLHGHRSRPARALLMIPRSSRRSRHRRARSVTAPTRCRRGLRGARIFMETVSRLLAPAGPAPPGPGGVGAAPPGPGAAGGVDAVPPRAVAPAVRPDVDTGRWTRLARPAPRPARCLPPAGL